MYVILQSYTQITTEEYTSHEPLRSKLSALRATKRNV